jgi:S1-C subfamily serine protease
MRIFVLSAVPLLGLICMLSGCAAPKPDPTVLHPEVAVVRIITLSGDPGHGGQGRGFFVSGDGMIVTRLHIIQPEGTVLVTPPGGKETEAQVVQVDKEADLAILKIPGEHHPFLRLFDGDIEPGMHVRVIGSEGVTHGVFDHWDHFGRDMAFTARISLNDGGAPLLGDDDRVVGVLRGLAESADAENDAAPIWRILHMMPKLAHPALFSP